MGPGQGRRDCGDLGPLPPRLKYRGEVGVRRRLELPDSPPPGRGGAGRGGGVHFRTPSWKGGVDGLGASEHSCMQRNMAKKRHVLTTAYVGMKPSLGKTRGVPGTPRPSPWLSRSSLFPEKPHSQALPAVRRGRRLFFCFLIANDFSNPPLPASSPPAPRSAAAPRKGRFPPQAVDAPRAPSPTAPHRTG